jgi:hypothetical protein
MPKLVRDIDRIYDSLDAQGFILAALRQDTQPAHSEIRDLLGAELAAIDQL